MDKARPIIILKKKGAHAGHHGGAWKVAYADFVTAMMARFIVLWLLNSSKQVQEAVGGYFKDPTGTAKKVGSNMQGAGENFVPDPRQHAQAQRTTAERDEADGGLRKTQESYRHDGDGRGSAHRALGIRQRHFFNSGSAKLNSDGAELLMTLAPELSGLPNKLSMEGHTDSQTYAPSATYGQLGTLRGPRQCRTPHHAVPWNALRSDHSSSRPRRPTPSETRRPSRPCQSAHLRHRSVHRQEPRRR